MSFGKAYAEQMFGKPGFFRKLFCFHLNWEPLPVSDWRTDERYYRCSNCYKIKNFGFRNIPVSYDHSK